MAATTTTSAGPLESDTLQAPLNEPSMEDILASIRRIIAEDQSNTLGRNGVTGLTRRTQIQPSPVPAEEAEAPSLEHEPVVEPAIVPHAALMAAPAESMDTYQPFGTHSEEPSLEPREIDHPAPTEAESGGYVHQAQFDTFAGPDQSGGHAQLPSMAEETEPLVSPSTGASISSSFQTLAESVMLQDPELIERVLRESMRPLLKAWLDDHLPSIVERLVRAEIERVARGGRARSY